MKIKCPRMPKSKYVSFDVFDTLVKRSVAKPTDLFLLMESSIAKTIPGIPAEFAQKRYEAEQQASGETGQHMDIEKIYDILRGEYGEYADELRTLELQLEIGGCRPNPKYVDLFNRCIASGKTVILISDMYLPSAIISEMLEKCGVRGYQNLYVSCECGAQKRDGSLFRMVLDDLKINPKELSHIGDNPRNDFLMPLSVGIKSIWIRNDQKKICRIPKEIKPEHEMTYRTIKACVRNCSQNMNEYEKQGCGIFGPLLYGFMQWLVVRLQEDEIKDVYFLARDGYMPMCAFEELGLTDIKTHYLYCSRRSYQVPMIWMHPDFDDATRLFRYNKRMTLRTLILRVGLEPDQYIERAREFDLQMDKTYWKGEIFCSSVVKSFYDSIKNDVVENSKKEYKSLVAYIKSIDFPEKIAVVDVGWHATIQQSLEELLRAENIHTTVKGYYVGLTENDFSKRSGEVDASGYLYDVDRGRELEKARLRSSVIFEAQFLSSHGSVKRFVFNDSIAKPEFEMYEYTKDSSQIIDESATISEYQKGAIAFVGYMREAIPLKGFMIPPEVALHGFTRLVSHPSLREANLWGDMRYINYIVSYCARPNSIVRYVLHPKEWMLDFHNSAWRIGFLRRCFKIPLRYDKVIDLIKRVYDKL